jgi:hypothetical protein
MPVIYRLGSEVVPRLIRLLGVAIVNSTNRSDECRHKVPNAEWAGFIGTAKNSAAHNYPRCLMALGVWYASYLACQIPRAIGPAALQQCNLCMPRGQAPKTGVRLGNQLVESGMPQLVTALPGLEPMGCGRPARCGRDLGWRALVHCLQASQSTTSSRPGGRSDSMLRRLPKRDWEETLRCR